MLISVNVCVHVCVRTCVHVYVCVHACMCVYMCMCVHVCAVKIGIIFVVGVWVSHNSPVVLEDTTHPMPAPHNHVQAPAMQYRQSTSSGSVTTKALECVCICKQAVVYVKLHVRIHDNLASILMTSRDSNQHSHECHMTCLRALTSLLSSCLCALRVSLSTTMSSILCFSSKMCYLFSLLELCCRTSTCISTTRLSPSW